MFKMVLSSNICSKGGSSLPVTMTGDSNLPRPILFIQPLQVCNSNGIRTYAYLVACFLTFPSKYLGVDVLSGGVPRRAPWLLLRGQQMPKVVHLGRSTSHAISGLLSVKSQQFHPQDGTISPPPKVQIVNTYFTRQMSRSRSKIELLQGLRQYYPRAFDASILALCPPHMDLPSAKVGRLPKLSAATFASRDAWIRSRPPRFSRFCPPPPE